MNKKIIVNAFLDSLIFSLVLFIFILLFLIPEHKEMSTTFLYNSNRGSVYNLKEIDNENQKNCNNSIITKTFNNSIVLKSDGQNIFVCKKENNNE